MIIHVAAEPTTAASASSTTVSVLDHDDLKAFRVDADVSSPSELAHSLERDGAGRFDGGYAWIDPEYIRRSVPSTVEDRWMSDFGAMIEYAQSKGFIASDGFVRAHVEWI